MKKQHKKQKSFKKTTSIGMSNRTRPKHKSKKRDFKRYRGQGKP